MLLRSYYTEGVAVANLARYMCWAPRLRCMAIFVIVEVHTLMVYILHILCAYVRFMGNDSEVDDTFDLERLR